MTTTRSNSPAERKHPSFCLYGPSGSGKTPQIGLFARRLFKESGGQVKNGAAVGGLRVRLYTKDRGGYDSILPEIELGLVEVVDLKLQTESPFIWTMKAVQGRMPEEPGSPKWTSEAVPKDRAGNTIGCWAFEGLTEWGTDLKEDIKWQRAQGVEIGGGNVDINIPALDEEGEDFGYAGPARGDYMTGQDRMDALVSRSMRLPGFIIWTALDLRTNDPSVVRQVVGPDVGVGSKLTAKMPQKFTYTFRTVNLAKRGGDEEKFRLYLRTHADPNIAGLTGVCNPRYPESTPKNMRVEYIEPADLSEAYTTVKKAREAAKAAILNSLK